MTNKFCSGCGEQVLREDAAICYNCGYWLKEDVSSQNNNEKSDGWKNQSYSMNNNTQQVQYVVVDSKSPALAIILSVIFPGAGQLYNKQFLKGILFQVGYFVSAFVGLFTLFIPTLIAWVLIIYEAYYVSDKMNKREIPLENPTAGEIILFILFWPIVFTVLSMLFLLLLLPFFLI